MAKFVMLGKYSAESIKAINSDRTKKAVAAVEKLGGKVNAIYGLLGDHDLLVMVDLPGVAEAMKASVALTKLSGIGFTTSPALTIEEFDKLGD